MAPLVVPDVIRFAMHYTLQGRQAVNILDWECLGGTPANEETATEIADILIDAWVADMMPRLSTELSFNSVSWISLDSLEGPTGSTTGGGTSSLPESGGIGTAVLPANVAAFIRKEVTSNRSTRNGRMYLPGVVEADTNSSNGNILTTTFLTNLNNALISILDDLTILTGGGGDPLGRPCVVHTPSGVTASKSIITNLVAEAQLATQRRRLRG